MSEPYEEPYKTCCACGERVLGEEFDKATGYCNECLIEDPDNQAACKADDAMDKEQNR